MYIYITVALSVQLNIKRVNGLEDSDKKMILFQKLIIYLMLASFFKAQCAKILGIFQVASHSHYTAHSTLMKILAENGHDVTIVSTHKDKNPPRNYKQVILTEVSDKMKGGTPNFYNASMNLWLEEIIFIYFCTDLIEDVFRHPKFQALMNSGEQFDAVIIEEFYSEALKYIAHHFKAPLIVLNAMDANEWVNHYQGNPDSPSYTPSLHSLDLSCNMSFFDRIFNSLVYIYLCLIRYFLLIPVQNSMLHKYYPEAPHLNDLVYNVSLVFLNADPSVHEPLPRVPSMINIGGYHIRKTEPLPEDLKKVLDNAKYGVIYFSMGSVLQGKDIPEDKLNYLLEAFSKLNETVLFKLEGRKLSEKPPNVVIRDWFPQNDVLAHKNVKLFITHGGLFSTLEAVYHAVPILSLPVFADQYVNSKRAASNGFAKYIPFNEIDDQNFNSYLSDMLKNQTYKKNIIKRSKMLTDKPISPAESVNFWVEYVISHQGAPHLKVASLNLYWYQYLLLDVIAFIFTLLLLTFYIARKLNYLIFGKHYEKIKPD
ncbi:hypothetical protein WA026_022507 [Henosepilachna vigintioctopunctata]|uniref:Glucuronosyltransferase n=1 Tax=Henosepilachna vigintioctopunctata TaxID=420089 RepID=A0AAW1UQG6_9CUCU